MIKKYLKEKPNRLDYLCPAAMMVLCDFIIWCNEKGITPVITETVTTSEEDQKINRSSSTHREGRAFDVSVRGWNRSQIDDCLATYSQRFRHLGAALSDGSRKLVYLHDAGSGMHFHFQVHKRFAVNFTLIDSA